MPLSQPDNQRDLKKRIVAALEGVEVEPATTNEMADAVVEELRGWWGDLNERATSDGDLVFEVDQQIVYGKGGTL